MPYSLFGDRFPEIAEKETRSIMVFDDPELPKDNYLLVELYCDEPECDCRRVMFHIFSEMKKKFIATIAWGWESKKFYQKWMSHPDPEAIDEMCGLTINRLSYQSNIAPLLLKKIRELILPDKKYTDRIKRHYKIFRKSVEEDKKKVDIPPVHSKVKVKRNAPCPCGSGKKYKHCCL